jgi:hypothetical protein
LLILKDAGGMRERRLAEYLEQCFPRHISVTTNKELAYALASLPPYQVPFSDVKVTHLHYGVCFFPIAAIFIIESSTKIRPFYPFASLLVMV